MWGPTEQEINAFYRSCKITAVAVVCGILLIGIGVGILVVKGCDRYRIVKIEEPRP